MYNWLTKYSFGFLIIVLCSPLWAPQALAKPNILLIIADDMGLDASPCHSQGSNLVRMPNLRQLCQNGLVFDSAYAAPTCSPTRATIMTGRYGFRTGIGGALSPRNDVSLSTSEVTLFDRLNKASDYNSALIGKWHLTSNRRNLDHPKSLGVDDYFGLFTGSTQDYFDWNAVDNGRRVSIKNYTTSELSDRAIQWIGAQKSPWFLWLAYTAPHTPFHVPPQNLHSFGTLPDTRRDKRQNPDKYYFAALEALDSEMGRVLKSMSPQTRNNTIVIFIGDNGSPGQLLRSKGLQDRAKASIYDGGTRVPLVIHGPNIRRGTSDALVNSTDLHATILGLAGVSSSAEDSIDLTDHITQGSDPTRKFAYVEHFSKSKLKGPGSLGWAIRQSNYKLVTVEGQSSALYDLKKDPYERNDLLKSNRNKYSQIAETLEKERARLIRN